eukprot:gene8957-906_t
MGLSQVTLCIVLLVLVSLCFASPVPCGQSISPLLEVDTLGHCSPQHTCEQRCSCGQSVYFDLATYLRLYSHRQTWGKVCPSKDNLAQWFESEVEDAGKKFDGSVKFGRKGRREFIKKKLKDLLSIFKEIQEKFEHICQGGKKLSNTDIYVLKGILDTKVKKRFFTFKGLFVKDFKKKIKKAAKTIFDKFISKFRGKSFDYCSCEPFFKAGTASQYSLYKNKLAQECAAKCSGAIVTEEYYELE